MVCPECNEDVGELFGDPRTPPLETAPCLCKDCAINAYDDVIYEAQETLADAQRAQENLSKGAD